MLLSFAWLTLGCTEVHASPCTAELESERKAKDAQFAGTEESPLSEKQRADFEGLRYFPGSEKYCVDATFENHSGSSTFNMPMFGEREPLPFRKFGVFSFTLDGESHRLWGYQRMDLPEEKRQWLLIPFKDDSNGKETYGGGRYLTVKLPIERDAKLDFNRAFNPTCVYNPKARCPVPPRENRLKVRIDAGEKSFVK